MNIDPRLEQISHIEGVINQLHNKKNVDAHITFKFFRTMVRREAVQVPKQFNDLLIDCCREMILQLKLDIRDKPFKI